MAGQSRSARSGKLIAVIDDDPAVRSSLKFALEIEGYEIRTFSDAAELLNDPEIARFECLIVDQHLPDLNGVELVQRLRKRSVFHPVILMTSRPSEFFWQQALTAGVWVIEKPLLGNMLSDAMDSALNRSGCGQPREENGS